MTTTLLVATPGFINQPTEAQNLFSAQALSLLGRNVHDDAQEPITWVIGDPQIAPTADLTFEDDYRTARVHCPFKAYAILDYNAGPQGQDVVTFLLPHEY